MTDLYKSQQENDSEEIHEHRFQREDYPFYWIVNVNARYSQLLERELKKVGLDISRFRVLTLAWTYRTASISQLAEYAVIKMPTVTKIVSRLRDDGLVTSAPSLKDARVTVVTPTTAGIQAAEQANELAENIFQRSFTGLKASQIDKMNQSLAQILHNLSD